MLQRNSLVKSLKFNDFCLLHFQVRNKQNMSENARNKKNQLRSDGDIQNKILAKC